MLKHYQNKMTDACPIFERGCTEQFLIKATNWDRCTISFKNSIYFLFQKQSMMVRQLEEELRMRMRGPSVEMQQQMEVLYNENEHLTREIAILRDTIKVSGLFIFRKKKENEPRILHFPTHWRKMYYQSFSLQFFRLSRRYRHNKNIGTFLFGDNMRNNCDFTFY